MNAIVHASVMAAARVWRRAAGRPLTLQGYVTALAALVVGLATVWSAATAHEVRPAYLEITLGESQAVILWKQPVAGEFALPLAPVFSNGWAAGAPSRIASSEGYLLKEWRISGPASAGTGATVRIDGLDRSMTDVLVRIRRPGAQPATRVLRPGDVSLVIDADGPRHQGSTGPVVLGVEHILTGYDHLLFVSALLLLVRGWRRLAWTISAFTVGHSITLTAAVLGFVDADPAIVEVLIALSVLMLAVEVVYLASGQDTFAARRPWAVAGGFGLLHGLGFAGSLTRAGLPPGDIAGVLLGFNLGVEIGQLAFVALVLGLAWIGGRLVTKPARSALVPAYGIGAMAAYWLIERVADAI